MQNAESYSPEMDHIVIPVRNTQGKQIGTYVATRESIDSIREFEEKLPPAIPLGERAAIEMGKALGTNTRIDIIGDDKQYIAEIEIEYSSRNRTPSHRERDIKSIRLLAGKSQNLPDFGIIRTKRLVNSSELMGSMARLILEHKGMQPEQLFGALKKLVEGMQGPDFLPKGEWTR